MLEALDFQFKESIKYGMTYNQFWYDEPELYYIYEQAYIEQLEERLKEKDIYNWQLGLYMQLAVGSCLAKEVKYPKEPLFAGKFDKKPQTTEDMLEKFKGMVAEVNKNF
jgi:hypothetical protein